MHLVLYCTHPVHNFSVVLVNCLFSILHKFEFASASTYRKASVSPDLKKVFLTNILFQIFSTIKSQTAVPPPIHPIAVVSGILNPTHGPLSQTPYRILSSKLPSYRFILPSPNARDQNDRIFWKDIGFHLKEKLFWQKNHFLFIYLQLPCTYSYIFRYNVIFFRLQTFNFWTGAT